MSQLKPQAWIIAEDDASTATVWCDLKPAEPLGVTEILISGQTCFNGDTIKVIISFYK